MYKLVITKKADKELDRLPKKDRDKILAACDDLCANPFAGKLLHDRFKGLRCIRVWPYRIIYNVNNRIITITVLKVGHRKDVYR